MQIVDMGKSVCSRNDLCLSLAKIFFAVSTSKKLSQVSMPLPLAISTMLLAGSTPRILVPFFLKHSKRTPTLLPISTTKSSELSSKSLQTESANSFQCLFPCLVVDDSYGYSFQ